MSMYKLFFEKFEIIGKKDLNFELLFPPRLHCYLETQLSTNKYIEAP